MMPEMEAVQTTQSLPERHVRYLASPAYGPLRTCRDPFVLVEGPRGSGKTQGILTELVTRTLEYPGARVILARFSRTDLSQTVLTTLEDEVFPKFGLKTPGNQSREGREVYDMPNGSQFIPLGLEKTTRDLSLNATYAYVAECRELSQQRVRDLVGAMRFTRSREHPTLPKKTQIIGDTNPADPAHWFNTWAEPVDDELRRVNTFADYCRLQRHNWAPAADPLRHPKRIVTKHMDNPAFFTLGENGKVWRYTERGDTYIREQLETLAGFQRDRWLHGLWVAAEGAVFPEFDVRKNVVLDFQIPEDWPKWLCVDPGYFHPCGVTWNTISPNGTEYTIAEIKQAGMTLDALARALWAKNIPVTKSYCDPAGRQQRQEASGKSFIDLMGERGVRLVPWPYAAKEAHDTSVANHRQRIIDGRYKVFKSCVATIAEHQSWAFRKLRTGEMPSGDDQYEDTNNDLLDGILGGERTNPEYPVPKPPPPKPDRPAQSVIPEQVPL